jgi:hypothetical protein
MCRLPLFDAIKAGVRAEQPTTIMRTTLEATG